MLNSNSNLDPQVIEGRLAFQTTEESAEYEAWLDMVEIDRELASLARFEPDMPRWEDCLTLFQYRWLLFREWLMGRLVW